MYSQRPADRGGRGRRSLALALAYPFRLFGGTGPNEKEIYGMLLVILHFIVMAITTLSLAIKHSSDPARPPGALVRWADFLGAQAAVLVAVQYVTQINMSRQVGCAAALSIPMMAIQTPGSIWWAFTLDERDGTRLSTWAVFVVASVLQCCLLAMCVVFGGVVGALWGVERQPEERHPRQGQGREHGQGRGRGRGQGPSDECSVM